MAIILDNGKRFSVLPDEAETAARVVSISTSVYLCGYEYPLPALAEIGGDAYLYNYPHPYLRSGIVLSLGRLWPLRVEGKLTKKLLLFHAERLL